MSDIHKKLDDLLRHAGTKGMRWGYNDGSPNGRRTAGEEAEDAIEKMEKVRENLERIRAQNEQSKAAIDKIDNNEALVVLRNVISGIKKTKNSVSKATAMLGSKLKSVSTKQKEAGSRILKSIFGR